MGNISFNQIQKQWTQKWLNTDNIETAKYNVMPIRWVLEELLDNNIGYVIDKDVMDVISNLTYAYNELTSNKKEYLDNDKLTETDYSMALDFVEALMLQCMKNMNDKIVT